MGSVQKRKRIVCKEGAIVFSTNKLRGIFCKRIGEIPCVYKVTLLANSIIYLQ